MEVEFKLTSTDKAERYKEFISYFKLLVSCDDEPVSTLANSTAALHEAFSFFWVGFYLVKGGNLVLGPFQGSPACTCIAKGRGVCGTAWAEGRSILVPDVEQFPGHIACSSLSRSEIVIPIISDNQVIGVLDIDSDRLNAFDDIDRQNLEVIAAIISQSIR